jgi:hypothetical protein
MIRELRAERGREKMAQDREAHGKAKPRNRWDQDDGRDDLTVAEAMALQHRDKLLAFQAQNAKRTTVRDEAADFDPTAADPGGRWATPEERALALKRQQKLLREMEWNAKPEYEKRQQVVSIDLTGKKVLRKITRVERPPSPQQEDEKESDLDEGGVALPAPEGGSGGAFSRNPLLGGLIRPVYDVKGKGVELEGRKDRKATRWRRVQDDRDDNEAVILDGGICGRAGDEPACG